MQLTIVKVYGIRFAKIIGNFLFDFVDFYFIRNYKKKKNSTYFPIWKQIDANQLFEA